MHAHTSMQKELIQYRMPVFMKTCLFFCDRRQIQTRNLGLLGKFVWKNISRVGRWLVREGKPFDGPRSRIQKCSEISFTYVMEAFPCWRITLLFSFYDLSNFSSFYLFFSPHIRMQILTPLFLSTSLSPSGRNLVQEELCRANYLYLNCVYRINLKSSVEIGTYLERQICFLVDLFVSRTCRRCKHLSSGAVGLDDIAGPLIPDIWTMPQVHRAFNYS